MSGQFKDQCRKIPLISSNWFWYVLVVFGFLFLSIWFTLVRYRVELLKEDSKRPWVKELASKLK